MSSDQLPPPSEDRRAAAIGWWTRLDEGRLSRAERAAFKAWLGEDEANQAAFAETCALWGDLANLPRPVPARGGAGAQRAPWRIWRFAIPALAVAALAAFLAFDDLATFWRADISTGTAEVKTVTLADGSRAQLNADTAIAMAFTAGQRRLTLLKGQAWFEVAPDRARPFTVEAGGGTVTALGTSFDVATDEARTEVTVTDHRVTVGAAGEEEEIKAGEQAAYGPSLALRPPHPVDADSATAWRRGALIFQDQPLGEVVAILDHYHHGFCWIIDPSIRKRLVTGIFHTADPLGAIDAIRLALGLHATYLGSYLILLRG